MPKRKASNEALIHAWFECRDVQTTAKRLKMSVSAVHERARRLRARGVVLPYHDRDDQCVNYDALAKLAARLRAEKEK